MNFLPFSAVSYICNFMRTIRIHCVGAQIFLCVLFFALSATAQIPHDVIDKLDLAEPEIAARHIKNAMKAHPNSAEAKFFLSLFEDNAENAVKQYRDMILLHKNSKYAPLAYFRIAQYYFAKGYYFSARKTFLEFAKWYPRSVLAERARYFAAKCLALSGKLDAAQIELRKSIAALKQPELLQLAREDLALLELKVKRRRRPDKRNEPVAAGAGSRNVKKTPVQSRLLAEHFAVQIGAYSDLRNAESQRKYFSLLGYKPEIAKIMRNGKTYYRVYVAKFATLNEAESYGRTFQKKYRLKYRIANLDE